MDPKKGIKRKGIAKPDATAAGTLSKSAKMTKLIVSGVDELIKQLKSKKNAAIEDLEIKATCYNNTVESFASAVAKIRELLPNLKSLSLDASNERDECAEKVLQNIFKTWNGSKTLESLSISMDWAQFKGMDGALTGFSQADCIKLRKSLGNPKNIPTGKFKKNKYTLKSLPGLKNLNLILCEVERIDETGPQTYNKIKFEAKVSVLQRYLFSKMKNLNANIELIDGDANDDHSDDEYYWDEDGSGSDEDEQKTD